MSSTTSAAFGEFLNRIQPTTTQWKQIESRHAIAAALLDEHFEGSNVPLLGTELMGSAAKSTIIRPVDDVDLIAQFDNRYGAFEKYRSDSRTFLYRVREALAGKRIETVGARGQAVRLFYVSGSHVDIAPVFGRKGGGYLLPSGEGSWISTDPLAAIAWFDQRDVDLDGHLRPLVQLLKKWNRAHSSRMRSFHLESLAATMFTRLSPNHRSNLELFFKHAPSRLSVRDTLGHSGRLDTYLTDDGRTAVLQQLNVQAARASRARAEEAAGKHREAMRLWAILLGAAFPAYS